MPRSCSDYSDMENSQTEIIKGGVVSMRLVHLYLLKDDEEEELTFIQRKSRKNKAIIDEDEEIDQTSEIQVEDDFTGVRKIGVIRTIEVEVNGPIKKYKCDKCLMVI